MAILEDRHHDAPALSARETPAAVIDCAEGGWAALRQSDTVLALVFGPERVQYGALHTDSSYARFVPGPTSGWGTSMILAPAFWHAGTYYQATRIATDVTIFCDRLQLAFSGTIGGLPFQGILRVDAPAADGIHGTVEISLATTFATEPRIGESFKLAMLSSMHVSDALWDTSAARIGLQSSPVPERGRLIPAPVPSRRFGLAGGDSGWKTRSPTVMIELIDAPEAQAMGFVNASSDPNDDNVGMWLSVDAMPVHWSYRFHVSAAQ